MMNQWHAAACTYRSIGDHPKCITGYSTPESTEHALAYRDRSHFIDARLVLEQHLFAIGCSRYLVLVGGILHTISHEQTHHALKVLLVQHLLRAH